MSSTVTNRRSKFIVLIALSLVVLIGVSLLHSISQDPRYHNFADDHTLAGLPKSQTG